MLTFQTLALSLLLTLVLEGVLALLWGVRDRRDWLLLVLVNAVTNPIVVSLHYLWNGSALATAGLELGAVLVEAAAWHLWGRDTRPALLFSLCSNCFSYFSGVLLNYFVGRCFL